MAIYASSEGPCESAKHDFSGSLFPPIRTKARMLMKIAGSLIFSQKIKCRNDFDISQN